MQNHYKYLSVAGEMLQVFFDLQKNRQWGCASWEYGTAGMGMRTDPRGKSRPLTNATGSPVPQRSLTIYTFLAAFLTFVFLQTGKFATNDFRSMVIVCLLILRVG